MKKVEKKRQSYYFILRSAKKLENAVTWGDVKKDGGNIGGSNKVIGILKFTQRLLYEKHGLLLKYYIT